MQLFYNNLFKFPSQVRERLRALTIDFIILVEVSPASLCVSILIFFNDSTLSLADFKRVSSVDNIKSVFSTVLLYFLPLFSSSISILDLPLSPALSILKISCDIYYFKNFIKYSFGLDSSATTLFHPESISETLCIFPLCKHNGSTTRDLQKTLPS